MKPWLVAIDGIDGAGKTRFADRLREECAARDLPAEVVRIDDFRRRVAWDEEPAPEADLYYDAYYDFAAVDDCLRAFTGGEPSVAIPIFDPVTERVVGTRQVNLRATRVLILEGVFTLRIPGVGAGTLVYLTTSYEEARRRIVERDLGKERSLEDVLRRIDRRYFPSQARYRAEHLPETRAEVVIDNEDVANPRTRAAEMTRIPPTLWEAIVALAPMG